MTKIIEIFLNRKDLNIRPLKIFNNDLKKYVVIQFFCAESTESYKNIPMEYWDFIIKWLNKQERKYEIIAIGTEGSEIIDKLFKKYKIINKISKTTLKEVDKLIRESTAYFGLDSGLMHMANLYDKPTFTFWGPSSSMLYGYEYFNSKKHIDFRGEYECSPCTSPTISNSIRFKSPDLCLDKRCTKAYELNKLEIKLDEFYYESLR